MKDFFQFLDKKATCLTRTEIKVITNSEKQRIKLNIFINFLKKKHFFLDLQKNALKI